MHKATDHSQVTYKVKEGEQWVDKDFPKPTAITYYNQHMGGVDVFDQLASSYRLLRRSKKFTKVLFADMMEIAIINSFKLFQAYRKEHPDQLPRPRTYSQYKYRENLIRALCKIQDNQHPPGYRPLQSANIPQQLYTSHTPIHTGERKICTVCWKRTQQRANTVFACEACRNQQGNLVHLCITQDRHCFRDYHSHTFDRYR